MIQKASAYTIASFDVPGAVNGTAGVAINDAGEVIGEWFDSNFVAYPFLESNGTIATFEAPGLAPPFGIYSGEWIDNAGEVVGTYTASNGTIQSFIENHGSVSTLDVPGSIQTVVDGINNSGEVLGAWLDSNFNEHDLVEKDGSFTSLSLSAGASLNFVGAINDAGTIAGVLDNGQNPPQVFIDQAGKITTFDPAPQLAKFGIQQLYINDTGEVAGEYYSTGTGFQGFLYDKGTVTSIPGANSVLGINNAGQVIGQYYPNGSERGFDYSDGTFTSIDPPGSTFTIPVGINNSGEITGCGLTVATMNTVSPPPRQALSRTPATPGMGSRAKDLIVSAASR